MRAAGLSPRVWLGLVTVYIVWGSTYLAIRVMVETVPPLLGAGTRFLIAGLVFYAALRLRPGGRRRVRVTRRQLAAATLAGTLLLFGGNGLVTVAEEVVPSGLAALVIASVPLWVVILRLVTRERVPLATLGGVALGFVGVALLVLPADRPEGAPLWGVLLIVLAAASWATGSFLSPKLPLPRDTLVATAVEMIAAGALMIVLGIAAGELGDLELAELSKRSLAAFAYLVFIGSLVAFTAYTWLLQNAPISTVATYAYVNPVVALALGALILDEEITATVVVGAAVIVGSVAFVVTRETEESGDGARVEAPPMEPATAEAAGGAGGGPSRPSG